MKILKYPYNFFVLSVILFFGGIAMEIITIQEVKHIPVTLVSSVLSFMLLIFGLIHLGIYRKISAERYLAKSAKIVYWLGISLFMCILLDAFVFPFDIGATGVYEKLFPFYLYSHLLLLIMLIID